ncbi:CDP-diacylglycerol-serine O-phosphatidyltransferase (Phosphatidylserine synthase) [Candidatus Glomeribacter gigasporarum BEG34]|uniref:CDP-diacylglycerol-serine O-phosphatidyltransferase (Phosphatidylserine synthase) n=1 Tax=Candidatus Glomeribacter gigasporarum BEG34 TaxID=1070319 RepID=G2JBH9_9BURK|nr:phosphatidylcholine/phosphatidylserine synthase [Candidatus Glomeribacter gigasporarum]CCD30133.1 CDP-diacylglycerol-serine O-phosphatidyltransferase (Phosphatidylserine synthase) [Candidatus Glomeribacter gigasporarum BEG34]
MAAFKARRTRATVTVFPNAAQHPANREPSRQYDAYAGRARRFRHRGIYLLPNALTTAALFCGFFAIVRAMNAHFETAAIAIFFAIVLDGMDGRIARMTKTQSAFGEQYDSLSDMVSFGAAPALIMYEWVLKGLGRWGWIAAFVYCAGTALRLARFNSNLHALDKRFFQGLPCPAAAALMAGFVWLVIDNRISVKVAWLPWFALALTLYAGITMASSAPFYSGKALDMQHRVPFGVLLLVVVAFVLVSFDPPRMLFGLFILYGLSGYAVWIWRRWRS